MMERATLAFALKTMLSFAFFGAIANAQEVDEEPPAPPPPTREQPDPPLPQASEPPPAAIQDSDETARRVDILTEEVARLREELVLPETEELRSQFGLGPAASRIYGIERGLSIGGYGEAHFQGVVSDRGESSTNVFDIPRVVLYAGYKFTPRILVNIELEFEHAKEAEVEFGYLEFRVHPAVNVRAGLLLLPIGITNELHEPPFYNGNLRPLVERRIIPTTWRELGVGAVGEPAQGLAYRVYVVTGIRAKGFGPGGWAAGRQHGRQAIGEDVAVVGRLDYELSPEVSIGVSGYHGGADQGEILTSTGAEVSVGTTLLEAHARLRWRGLQIRALGAYGLVSNAAYVALAVDPQGTTTIGSRVAGVYGELSYDIAPHLSADARFAIAPWVRVEWVDTELAVPDVANRPDDQAQQIVATSVGVAVHPVTNVVLKAEYVGQVNRAKTPVVDSVFVGAGFVF